MKVLFLGSPKFAKDILNGILSSRHEVVAVICQPDRPAGRGHKFIAPEVKTFAQEKGIEVLQFDKVSQHIPEIFSKDFDAVVVASFGQILSREFLSKKLALNVHPSKLPKYRGATPLQTALLNGDKETAVSIQKMEYEVDSGDILLCESLPIEETDDYASLSDKAAGLGAKMIVQALDLIEDGNATFKPQVGEISFTKKIEKNDGYLDFNSEQDPILNKIRALATNPGCFFMLGEDRIKVYKAESAHGEGTNGQILAKDKELIIRCNNGAIKILSCQAPGGKVLNARDFLNGYKIKVSKVN